MPYTSADEGGNVAFMPEYANYRQQQELELFLPQCKRDERMEKLSDGYSLKTIKYENFNSESIGYENIGDRYHRTGSIDTIIDASGKEIYTYRCIDNSAAFCKVFTHSNGRQYAIFRRDLFGYSALDFQTLQDFHYIPALSFSGHGETFIWVGFDYNIKTDILAVSGCFWGAPYDVCLVEMKDPMQQMNRLCVLHDYLDPDCDKYIHIEFIDWECKQLKVSAENQTENYDESKDTLVFTPDEYMDG